MNRFTRILQRTVGVLSLAAALWADAQGIPAQGFAGALKQSTADVSVALNPVRNDIAQPGQEVVTLRYFKIKKGAFPEFLKASQEGVWPYFEKIGSRVIGMWKVIHPAAEGGTDSPDFDEVYLMTRYASVAHWEASREPQKHGGNGPDWDACKKALDLRASLTIETHLTFLQGDARNNPPMFLPGLDEKYEPAEHTTSKKTKSRKSAPAKR